MRFRFIIAHTLSLLPLLVQGQDYSRIKKKADSLYRAREFQKAIQPYRKLISLSDFKLQKLTNLYGAARCYALSGNKDSAFVTLHELIQVGYGDKSHLGQDKDFISLHKKKEWTELLRSIKEEKKILNKIPSKAGLVTDDIYHFWEAYDRAQKDTSNKIDIYKKYYFEKGSEGLNDYMGMKVKSIRGFVRHYDRHRAFYPSIRKNTLKVDSLKPSVYTCFKKLKTIYPQALFPNVYFIMGAFTSGGTVSNAGLLIGINQVCKTDDIPLGELNLWEKNNFNPLQNLPSFISHELIHFQQDELMQSEDTTTLLPVVVEGMADFLGEMISGKNINQRLHEWAKGRERNIWEEFSKDMNYNRTSNWIANANQETADNPADQGYWVGYQICRAYYLSSQDKQQAIYEMMHFKNVREFLKKSKWEEIVLTL